MQSVSFNKNSRNYGIDVLRIVAMLFIVTGHSILHGNIISNSQIGTANYYISTFFQTVVWCGVDVFALISGFVGFQHQKRHRVSGFLRLWLQVLFYSAGISLLFYFLYPGSISGKELLKSFAPLTTKAYWYFTAYFFVILFAPLLNNIVLKYSKKYLIYYAIMGGAVLYLSHLLPVVLGPILLIYMYFIGAFLSKYQGEIKLNNAVYIALIACLIFFTWVWRIYLEPVKPFLGILWLRNDSPTIIIVSLCLLMLFSRFKPSNIFLISAITPSIFSVYLLNDHYLIRKYFISEHFSFLFKSDWYILVCYILGFSILFFTAAVLFDLIRRKIEKKLSVQSFVSKIEEHFYGKIKNSKSFIQKNP